MTSTIDQRRRADTALSTIAGHARDYAAQSKAPSTLRAYQADWRDFTTWCAEHELRNLPADPETIALYLAALAGAGRKMSTLQRRISAISQAHQLAGYATPTKDPRVRQVFTGIRRLHGTAQQGKAPVVTAELRRMLATLPTTILGTRDRALLLLGYAGAFRRSELVALDLGDLEETEEGLVATIRRSKTDQEGGGRRVGIPYGSHLATCPVRSTRAWLEASEADGNGAPLFRPIDRHGNIGDTRLSDKAVALIVKRTAEAAGLDPAKYAGHSLRAGLATAAAQAGVSERAIMAQTGHTSLLMLRKYIREGSLFRENAAASVGL